MIVETIAVVAILKGEDKFIEEWIAYHRLLGVDEFVLYDDDPRQHLRYLLRRHEGYVKVIDSTEGYQAAHGRNVQTRAYENALLKTACKWIAFIDGDEFIVLRKHSSLKEFIVEFDGAHAVMLTWHLFGHNGYYEDPPGLIIESLTRRQTCPGNKPKVIAKRDAVTAVLGAHRCKVADEHLVFDANHRRFVKENYPGKTDIAHINHYMCRSFQNWMARVTRGDVAVPAHLYPARQAWRYEKEACLIRFVKIAATCNELVDDYMLRYVDAIRQYLANLPG